MCAAFVAFVAFVVGVATLAPPSAFAQGARRAEQDTSNTAGLNPGDVNDNSSNASATNGNSTNSGPTNGPGQTGANARGGGVTGNEIVRRTQQAPIEISASGDTTYRTTPQGRIATAANGVSIQTSDASIYCDYCEYNLDTHEGLLVGDVRIYRLDTSLFAERAVYNFDTKGIRALDLHGTKPPYNFGGVGLFSPSGGAQYNLRNARFTTDDSSTPDYYLRARRIRIYPDDRVIYINATLFVGQTPIFYFPYFYQSLDQQSGYQITPGYSSVYGAYLLAGVTFPLTEHITGIARLDYRSKRGLGAGLSFEYKPNRRIKTPPVAAGNIAYASDDDEGASNVVSPPTEKPKPTPANGSDDTGGNDNDPNGSRQHQPGFVLTGDALSRQIRNREGTQLLTFFIHDEEPDLNRTALDRLPVDPDRYRLSLKSSTFITDDLTIKADIEKISDRYLLQDFYQGEFTRNPNPDNVVFATYYQPNFIASITGRAQLNTFFNATERLPELAFDLPRQPLWDTGIYYEGENSTGYLKRTFDSESPLPEYDTFRIDTFHQLSYAKTFFGWLSVVPRLGFRATYYSHSAPSSTSAYDLQNVADDTEDRTLFDLNPKTASAADLKQLNELEREIGAFKPEGDIFRPVVDAGVESSFKVSRVYEGVESRALGIDDLQHVVQPYVNFSEVEDFGVGSRQLLQFDRRVPSTQLQPIDFPEFTSIDSIDESTVARVGVRNRLQTKRDALTFDWLELDTFFQYNIYDPSEQSSISNVFNQLTLRPVPWINFTIDSQLPIFNGKRGFTEVDSSLAVQVTSNLDVTISHRYLDNNPFFANSSLLRLNVYYRLDDNWAAGFSERYEFAQHLLEAQSYTVYRDLSSFVASLGLTVQNNGGVSDVGVLLNITLKGVPKVNLPVGFDVNSLENQVTQ